ncbi:MAG: type II secretion system protein [Gammaproteobacteria bacterium]|jgi:type II secretory pathway pseudopilin PulG|nr:type II secretion system protein [Gammaproteobacteria bacterium]MBU1409053.1 type II secretion system protein [Gammaproteobacteria bacterium]MBU1533526.1 type II secretion system protein [Gammaproteobacteria bacterium]
MAGRTPTGRRRRAIRQRGFTLLGLLFLVAGLGVAMAALGTVWHSAAQREKERDLLFAGDQYRRAVESFWNVPLPVGTPRRLPKNFAELLLDPRFPQTVRHLRHLYRDPMTGDAEWGLLKGPDGGISGVLSLSDGTPFKRANFPSDYARFEDAQSYRDWVFQFDVEKAQNAGQGAKAAPAGKDAAGITGPGSND